MLRVEKSVKEEIKERLNELEGNTVYLSDLSFKLFESEYYTGSYTCNSYASIKWIKDYFKELTEIVEEYKRDMGDLPCPFSEPEKFQLIIILHLSGEMLTKAIYNADLVEDAEIELTAEIIDKIIEAL